MSVRDISRDSHRLGSCENCLLPACFSAMKKGSEQVNFNFPVKDFLRTDRQRSCHITEWDSPVNHTVHSVRVHSVRVVYST